MDLPSPFLYIQNWLERSETLLFKWLFGGRVGTGIINTFLFLSLPLCAELSATSASETRRIF
jgi:hypothetical protein